MRRTVVYVHFTEDTFARRADFVERHSVAAIGWMVRSRERRLARPVIDAGLACRL